MSPQSINFSAFDKAAKLPAQRDFFLSGAFLAIALLFGFTVKAVFGNNLYIRVADGLALAVTAIVFGLYAYRLYKDSIQRNIALLTKFAKDNGFNFFFKPEYSSNGVIFSIGNNDHKSNYFLNGVLGGLPFALYWHSFTTGNGKATDIHCYGVIEISLPKEVPQIFIEEKTNNFQAYDVLNVFKAKNLMHLEGDFNKSFNVYAAPNYQVEELTILNPAFMAALVDQTDKFHIELVDNRAYIYKPDFMEIKKELLSQLFIDGQFLIQELKKEMDTFKYSPDAKVPDNMQPSKIKTFLT